MCMVLFVALLLVSLTTQSLQQIQVGCNEDVRLICDACIQVPNFRSVAWYKIVDHDQIGIVRKVGNETQHYHFNRTADFGEDHSLLLPSVRPGDSGTYECAIGAKVGGKNRKSQVILTVPVCVTQAYLTTMTHTSPVSHVHMKELPVIWSVVGYVGVGLVKIALCFITIGVIQAIHSKSSRRNQQRWGR
ncbi:uncharacterized protein ACJ7VT_013488 [Polymixia lowei]